jgi:hypothetical protein
MRTEPTKETIAALLQILAEVEGSVGQRLRSALPQQAEPSDRAMSPQPDIVPRDRNGNRLVERIASAMLKTSYSRVT